VWGRAPFFLHLKACQMLLLLMVSLVVIAAERREHQRPRRFLA
jgi:hypothetical protein